MCKADDFSGLGRRIFRRQILHHGVKPPRGSSCWHAPSFGEEMQLVAVGTVEADEDSQHLAQERVRLGWGVDKFGAIVHTRVEFAGSWAVPNDTAETFWR